MSNRVKQTAQSESAMRALAKALRQCQDAGIEIQASNNSDDAMAIFLPCGTCYTIAPDEQSARIKLGRAPQKIWDKYFDIGHPLPLIEA